jgi:hypothetical protein
MTKILTALTFAIALGLSMATASAESQGGQSSLNDAALPIVNVGH